MTFSLLVVVFTAGVVTGFVVAWVVAFMAWPGPPPASPRSIDLTAHHRHLRGRL